MLCRMMPRIGTDYILYPLIKLFHAESPTSTQLSLLPSLHASSFALRSLSRANFSNGSFSLRNCISIRSSLADLRVRNMTYISHSSSLHESKPNKSHTTVRNSSVPDWRLCPCTWCDSFVGTANNVVVWSALNDFKPSKAQDFGFWLSAKLTSLSLFDSFLLAQK